MPPYEPYHSYEPLNQHYTRLDNKKSLEYEIEQYMHEIMEAKKEKGYDASEIRYSLPRSTTCIYPSQFYLRGEAKDLP